MKYRPHRRLLCESLKDCVNVEDMAALIKHLKASWPSYMKTFEDGDVSVKKYGGFDKRIGWDTHIVCINGNDIGFTNGEIK